VQRLFCLTGRRRAAGGSRSRAHRTMRSKTVPPAKKDRAPALYAQHVNVHRSEGVEPVPESASRAVRGTWHQLGREDDGDS
jgi:hypothetical protein